MGVITNFENMVLAVYNSIITMVPPWAGSFINLFLIVLLIVLYSIFIWKFYRFIARKDIIKLNLSKYNRASYPLLEKITATSLYLVEYILVLPFIIFFWFSVFTIFLIFLTEDIALSNLLVISATIIAAIRMISYHNENLSKEIAKILPFMLLAISILNPRFFSVERVFGHFTEIPGFFNEITIYLIFIIMLELILRVFDFIFSLFGVSENEELKKVKEKDGGEDDDEED